MIIIIIRFKASFAEILQIVGIFFDFKEICLHVSKHSTA